MAVKILYLSDCLARCRSRTLDLDCDFRYIEGIKWFLLGCLSYPPEPEKKCRVSQDNHLLVINVNNPIRPLKTTG